MNALIVLFLLSYFTYSMNFDRTFVFIYFAFVAIYTLLTQHIFFKTPFNAMRNKVTVATWDSPSDPDLYAQLKINVSRIEPYLEKRSKETGKKFTLTLFSIKLLSIVLSKVPELNSFIKYGVIKEKKGIDLCCLVTIGEGEDLANAVIRDTEKKTCEQIHDELNESVEKLRKKKNAEHNKKNTYANKFPNFILAILTQITSYVSSIGYELKSFGVSNIVIY